MINSHADAIGRWGSIAALAADLGEKADTVRRWRLRNHIPARHWRAMERAASERGLSDVTAAALLQVARFEPAPPAAPEGEAA